VAENVPLIKVLTESGAGSRRAMTAAIKAGRVMVNGVVVSAFTHPVDVARDNVTLDWQPVKAAAPGYTYLMLHKPVGVLTTTRDERHRPTVMGLLPEKYRALRLYPVGRLDKDSSGLLLLTNDGNLTYRLTHPRYEHEKEYLVRLDAALSVVDIRRFRGGLDLEDGVTRAARCEPLHGEGEFRYRVVIHEGRKRQIRRMFATLGRRVMQLERVRLGPLHLENLEAGRTRELTSRELRDLKAA
jgi:23S rRNA pseudouridine2605 synthase